MKRENNQIIYRAGWGDVAPVPHKYIPDEHATKTELSGKAIAPDGKEFEIRHYSFYETKDMAWKAITQNSKTDVVLSGREVESARIQLEKAREGAGRAAEKFRLIQFNEENPYREL